MTVVGDYHPIGRFLTAVASLPRIITPVGLELEVSEGLVRGEMVVPIAARLRVETYVLGGTGPRDALLEEAGSSEDGA